MKTITIRIHLFIHISYYYKLSFYSVIFCLSLMNATNGSQSTFINLVGSFAGYFTQSCAIEYWCFSFLASLAYSNSKTLPHVFSSKLIFKISSNANSTFFGFSKSSLRERNEPISSIYNKVLAFSSQLQSLTER